LTAATLPPTVITWAARPASSRDSYLPLLVDSLAVAGRPEWLLAVCAGGSATLCLLLTAVAMGGGWRPVSAGEAEPAPAPPAPTKAVALALLATYALLGVWVTGGVSAGAAAAWAAAAVWAACALSLSVTFVHLQAHLDRLSAVDKDEEALADEEAPAVTLAAVGASGAAAPPPPAPSKVEALKVLAVRKLRPACVSGMWVAVGKTGALAALTSTAGIMRFGWVRLALWTARASAEYTAVFFGVVVLALLAADLRLLAQGAGGDSGTEAARRAGRRIAKVDGEAGGATGGGEAAEEEAMRLAVWR